MGEQIPGVDVGTEFLIAVIRQLSRDLDGHNTDAEVMSITGLARDRFWLWSFSIKLGSYFKNPYIRKSPALSAETALLFSTLHETLTSALRLPHTQFSESLPQPFHWCSPHAFGFSLATAPFRSCPLGSD